MDQQLLMKNVVSTAKTAKAFGLPIVHSTISVASGRQKPTVPELAEVLEGNVPIDRTSINSWEDADFVAAVRSTGRRKLIFCALWTEVCMAFPALDALREGFEVYPVVDAIGGTSVEAHRAGLERVALAGGQPISWVCAGVRASTRLGARRDRPTSDPNRTHRTPPSRMSKHVINGRTTCPAS